MFGNSDAQFHDILDTWSQGIAIRQCDQFVYVNQAFANLCGYESPEAVLSLDSVFSLKSDDERERLSQYGAARKPADFAPDACHARPSRGCQSFLCKRRHSKGKGKPDPSSSMASTLNGVLSGAALFRHQIELEAARQ